MSNLPLPVGGNLDTYGAATASSSGTSVANGSYAQITASTTKDYDGVVFMGTQTGTSAEGTCDLAVGGAGSEQNIIDNIRFQKTGTTGNGFGLMAYLPLFIPRGSRIACQGHGITPKVIIAGVTGMPLNQRGFSRAESIGIASNQGVAIDPGATANTLSAWVQLTASSAHNYAALMIAVGPDARSSNAAAATWLIDIGIGASGSEQVLLQQLSCIGNSTANYGPYPALFGPFPCNIPAGTRIAVRAQSSSTNVSQRQIDVAAYGFIR
jgi:hypothetical protein